MSYWTTGVPSTALPPEISRAFPLAWVLMRQPFLAKRPLSAQTIWNQLLVCCPGSITALAAFSCLSPKMQRALLVLGTTMANFPCSERMLNFWKGVPLYGQTASSLLFLSTVRDIMGSRIDTILQIVSGFVTGTGGRSGSCWAWGGGSWSAGEMTQHWLALPWNCHWQIYVPGLGFPPLMSRARPQKVLRQQAFPAQSPFETASISKKELGCCPGSDLITPPSLGLSPSIQRAWLVVRLTRAYLVWLLLLKTQTLKSWLGAALQSWRMSLLVPSCRVKALSPSMTLTTLQGMVGQGSKQSCWVASINKTSDINQDISPFIMLKLINTYTSSHTFQRTFDGSLLNRSRGLISVSNYLINATNAPNNQSSQQFISPPYARVKAVVLRSEHEDLEPPLLAVGLEHPDPLDGLAVELSLVVDGVHPDVLLLEPHGRRVLVETALQLKLPHRVLPLPLHVPHRDRVDEKVGEVHWSLLIVLLVVSVPLSDLLKVGHGRRCATQNYTKSWMGSSASVEAQVHPAPSIIPPESHPQPPITDSKATTEAGQFPGVVVPKDNFSLSMLETILAKAFQDLNSTDVMAKIKYFDRVIEFILSWLPEAVRRGKSLFEAEKMVCDVLRKAELAYPLAQFQRLECRIKNVAPQKKPNLAQDLNPVTKQRITDRIKQLCLRSKANAYAFNKEMQIILEKEGGFKFKAGCKFSGIKSYLRIMTKIMEESVSEELGSRQVYTDLNHYYWTPVFVYFNKLLDQHPEKVKIELYDWMRCKVLYRNIRDLQNAFDRLSRKHKENIFRVKNRINEGTRDILINLVFKGEYTEVQLALDYDNLRYQFKHKLYELTREKLGVAFSCFTFTIHAEDDQGYSPGLMTSQGYVKKCLLREKLEPGFVRLTQEEAVSLGAQIGKLVGKADVIALKTGCLKGLSFGPDMVSSQIYGPEINHMMVIKKKTTNFEENWLNWMD